MPRATQRIVALARAWPPTPVAELGPRALGWAIWITGRPGSGKTTVCRPGRFRDTRGQSSNPATRARSAHRAGAALLPHHPEIEAEHEIVCRALAYAAKLLTESRHRSPHRCHRRAGGAHGAERARELIPRFCRSAAPVSLIALRRARARGPDGGLGGEGPSCAATGARPGARYRPGLRGIASRGSRGSHGRGRSAELLAEADPRGYHGLKPPIVVAPPPRSSTRTS